MKEFFFAGTCVETACMDKGPCASSKDVFQRVWEELPPQCPDRYYGEQHQLTLFKARELTLVILL